MLFRSEPVPPDEQHPALIIEQDGPGGWCHADEPVIEVPAVRQLDIGGAQVKPLVSVELSLGDDFPIHAVSPVHG